ncbi:hypothetical protein AQJ66_36110 [Streptomyces bungoensis]|uniref:Uncharacterized protein n=1 Tax=Streptomyces bungoensis TaxID=285568 RepID=A0A101SJB4_9ACTN|nr:hypothetical protein [Streptomyces bungoensis]KUN75290.1 hypothetical protein AQJ66_36110 [Streptomyces bungoensis]
MPGHGSPGLIAVAAGESIAAGVGVGIAGPGRFRPVAAWAWMWRDFDDVLPDTCPVPKEAALPDPDMGVTLPHAGAGAAEGGGSRPAPGWFPWPGSLRATSGDEGGPLP